MIDAGTLQKVRDAAQAITTASAFVDRLRDTEPEAARGTPGSRRRELNNLSRRLEAERGRLEMMYS
jgi:hypothetical protein